MDGKKTTLLTVAAGIDKDSLFWIKAGENLKLCAVTECIPIYSGPEKTATIIWNQTIWNQILNTNRIVKKAFFGKQAGDRKNPKITRGVF